MGRGTQALSGRHSNRGWRGPSGTGRAAGKARPRPSSTWQTKATARDGGRARLLSAAILLGALAIGGCTSDSQGPEEEAFDDVPVLADAMINGETVATYDNNTGGWTAGLTVAAGQESPLVTLRFTNAAGEVIAFGSEFVLDTSIGDDGVAGFRLPSATTLGGHVVGVSPGQTGMQFLLMHDEGHGEPHPHFFTTSIQIVVTN